jgi:hypothetical protein
MSDHRYPDQDDDELVVEEVVIEVTEVEPEPLLPEGEGLLVEEEEGPDFARGQEVLPEDDEARPDFARGQEEEPTETGKPDYARGQREYERDPEAPDFARGQREGELLDADLLEEEQNPPQV